MSFESSQAWRDREKGKWMIDQRDTFWIQEFMKSTVISSLTQTGKFSECKRKTVLVQHEALFYVGCAIGGLQYGVLHEV